MNLGLDKKVAIVTGGSSGIGEAIVRLLLAEGAFVAIVDKQAPALAGTDRSEFFKTELTNEEECRRAVGAVVARFGQLDILVNNAGVNDHVPLDAAPSEFLESLRRNLVHVAVMAHFSVPHLRASRGAIVNITSKVAVTGQGKTSGYAAAKGGVNALTREWAAALAADGIRVNAVAPAECWTPLYERELSRDGDPGARKAAIARRIPLGQRFTEPAEIARTVVFLASPASSHTTGQIIYVDGGYTHLDRALLL